MLHCNSTQRAGPWQGKMSRSQSNLVAGFSSDKFRPIRISTLTLYGIVSPCRVWCEHTKCFIFIVLYFLLSCLAPCVLSWICKVTLSVRKELYKMYLLLLLIIIIVVAKALTFLPTKAKWRIPRLHKFFYYCAKRTRKPLGREAFV